MIRVITLFIALQLAGLAAPTLHEDVFGKSLGGWDAKSKRAADYEISGSKYRTWKPAVSPQLDGGLFISVRIDHRRGLLASDDHASLEINVDSKGNIISARSTIALQGKKVSSDLIRSTGKLGSSVAGLEKAAKIGTDLVADLTAKILRENIKEPGRVSFPAVVKHNYNLLVLAISNGTLQAIEIDANGNPVPKKESVSETESTREKTSTEKEKRKVAPLDIKK